jgi:hypothetical protein
VRAVNIQNEPDSGWFCVADGALRVLTDPATTIAQCFYRMRQW